MGEKQRIEEFAEKFRCCTSSGISTVVSRTCGVDSVHVSLRQLVVHSSVVPTENCWSEGRQRIMEGLDMDTMLAESCTAMRVGVIKSTIEHERVGMRCVPVCKLI